jgi:hypothetical protein
MLKGILKDPVLKSSDERKQVVAPAWNGLIFDDVRSVIRNWMNRLTWVIETNGECIRE